MKAFDWINDLPLDGRVEMDVPMKALTTMRVGGPADCVVYAASVRDAEQVARACAERRVPLMVMGRGSNLVVRDGGLRGVVLRLDEAFSRIEVRGTSLTAQAGATLGALARAAQEAGLAGLEFAEGIPGSVGGGVYMNAGAYGGEMKHVLRSVRALLPGGEICALEVQALDMGYRHTALMEMKAVVLEAVFDLKTGDRSEIAARMADYARRRREKQPLQYPSSGSFFKRPEGYFAGKLIEEAGLKGERMGGAQISELHAGFLINADNATAQDVLALMQRVQKRVYDRFCVRLEPEVRIIGEEKEPK